MHFATPGLRHEIPAQVPLLRVAFQEIVRGAERRDERVQCRSWKLFLLLPRMLLFRPGDWELLLRESEGCDGAARRGFQRRRRNKIDTLNAERTGLSH